MSKYTSQFTGREIDEKLRKVNQTFTEAEKQKLAALNNYDDNEVKISITNLENNKANKTDVYNKTETDNKITEKVAEIVAGAPEEFNTLKEMSDWLTEHEDSAATMNTAILKNKEDIAANAEAIEENKNDILKAENDIAVNRTTLGTQCKNLLNHTAKTETVNGVNITVNTDGSITFAGTFNGTSTYYHQIYRNADGSNKTIGKGKYIVSGGAEEFGFFVKYGTNFSGNNGTQFNVKTSDVPITIESETELIDFFVPLSPAREYNATIYPMLRPADITDDTYEPYKPSLQKQINSNQNDILNLRNDTFGTPAARVTSNSDLDTFTTTGSYICLSSAIAKTLINCPISIGFRMDVKALGAGVERYAQTIYPNEVSNVYCYFRRLTSEGWTAWDKVVGGEVYGLGIQIKSNSDLNDPAYFVPGVYRAPSNDVAGSLLNCPIKRGFRMEVKESIYAGVGIRLIYPNAIASEFGTFYMQNVTATNGVQHLGNWFKFRGEEVLPTTTTTE